MLKHVDNYDQHVLVGRVLRKKWLQLYSRLVPIISLPCAFSLH